MEDDRLGGIRIAEGLCVLNSGASAGQRQLRTWKTCATEAIPPVWRFDSATTSISSIAGPDSALSASKSARSSWAASFRHVFVSHFHWDHIQGFPFFRPLYERPNRFLFHCSSRTRSLKRVMEEQMASPFLPGGPGGDAGAARVLRSQRGPPLARRHDGANRLAQPSPGLHGFSAGNQGRGVRVCHR